MKIDILSTPNTIDQFVSFKKKSVIEFIVLLIPSIALFSGLMVTVVNYSAQAENKIIYLIIFILLLFAGVGFVTVIMDKLGASLRAVDDLKPGKCWEIRAILECPDVEKYKDLVIHQARKFKACELEALSMEHKKWKAAECYKKLYGRELTQTL